MAREVTNEETELLALHRTKVRIRAFEEAAEVASHGGVMVAAGLPIAVGAAHARLLRQRRSLAACFFGDGAINRGLFLQSLNRARVHGLPVLALDGAMA